MPQSTGSAIDTLPPPAPAAHNGPTRFQPPHPATRLHAAEAVASAAATLVDDWHAWHIIHSAGMLASADPDERADAVAILLDALDGEQEATAGMLRRLEALAATVGAWRPLALQPPILPRRMTMAAPIGTTSPEETNKPTPTPALKST